MIGLIGATIGVCIESRIVLLQKRRRIIRKQGYGIPLNTIGSFRKRCPKCIMSKPIGVAKVTGNLNALLCKTACDEVLLNEVGRPYLRDNNSECTCQRNAEYKEGDKRLHEGESLFM